MDHFNNFNEHSFNYENKFDCRNNVEDSKEGVISFNYECDNRKGRPAEFGGFDNDMKCELLNKFQNSDLSKEVDYDKFQKSLDIILKMKQNVL